MFLRKGTWLRKASAYDPIGRNLYISSVSKCKIVVVGEDAVARDGITGCVVTRWPTGATIIALVLG